MLSEPAAAPGRLHQALDRIFGIPHLTAIAAGWFRIVIGALLVWLIWNNTAVGYPTGVVVPLNPGTGYGAGRWELTHWIRANPDAHLALYRLTLGAAIAFTLGALTRVAATVLWVGLFLLIAASLATSGNHTWLAPWLALLGLPLTPLGDAVSLDALWRRRSGAPSAAAPSPAYGFAVWWIGLALGLAFLGAAFAKVNESGLAWATGGAIRYHFVEDAGHAPVPWGLWVAGQPVLAVAVSSIGLLVESVLIAVIFCRKDRYRAAFGAAFVSMHLGFYVFQGVLWTPWLAMAVAFLPWGTLSRRLTQSPGSGLRAPRLGLPHAAALVIVLALQVYASARKFEYEPLLSHYPMYSGTYASWEEFFRRKRWHKYQTYRFHVRDGSGARVEISAPSELMSPLDVDRIIDTLQAAADGDEAPERSGPALEALAERLRARFGSRAESVEVDIATRRVNFAAMRIEEAAGTAHAFTLRLAPPEVTFASPAFAVASQ